MQTTINECQNLVEQAAGNRSNIEIAQLSRYLHIFKNRTYSEHWQVNKYISQNNLWGEFNILHSINTHANGYQVDGVWPYYFKIICQALDISDSGGSKLIKSDSPDNLDENRYIIK